MASTEAVSRAVRALAECFPHREITTDTVPVYAIALQDMTDADLDRAVKRALRTLKFFPAPAELRDLVGANAAPEINVEAILERIRGLFTYLPNSGDQAPRVETVRRELGDAIAAAYGALGGGERLFSANETTRSIARREFADELRQFAKIDPTCLALPPIPVRALPAVQLYGEPPRPAGLTLLRGHVAR